MRLIFVRHGETDGNKNKQIISRTDVLLNATGVQQAEAVAKRLAHEPIAAIYVSNLQRAHVTAQKIAAFHSTIPLVIDSRLRERDYGEYEKEPFGTLAEAAKNEGVLPYNFRPFSGESIPDAINRALPVVEYLVSMYKGKTVVVASHGGLIRGLVMHLLRVPAEQEKQFIHDNTGVTIIDISDDGNHVAHVINDTSHLS